MSNTIQKPENRGGARPGAGRKPIYTISEREIKQLVKAARKKAKETGKTPAEVLMDLAYKDGDKRTALGELRVYLEHTTVKNVEKDVGLPGRDITGPLILSQTAKALYDALSDEERRNLFPPAVIILPEQRPDPAKQILFAGSRKAVAEKA